MGVCVARQGGGCNSDKSVVIAVRAGGEVRTVVIESKLYLLGEANQVIPSAVVLPCQFSLRDVTHHPQQLLAE